MSVIIEERGMTGEKPVNALIPVEGYSWTSMDVKDAGKYRDQNGFGLSGFFYRDFKATRHAIPIGNGLVLSRYRYPRFEIPFKSPMHRWDNLFFCGGYRVCHPDGRQFDTHERLVEYVVTRKKPMGFVVAREDEVDKLVGMVGDGIDYKIVCTKSGRCTVGFANRGVTSHLFDIDSLIESYQMLNEGYPYSVITEADLKQFETISQKRFSDFLDYDYAHPCTVVEFLKVGFILGYPIESTFAVINGLR